MKGVLRIFVSYGVVLFFLSSSCFVNAQFKKIKGEWSGVIPTNKGGQRIALNLSTEKGDSLIGTLYDSVFTDATYCYSEVVAKQISEKRFLIEGRKMLRFRNSFENIHNLSIIYFDFENEDTIVAQKIEEGNYASLLGKNKKLSSTFKMGRKKIDPPISYEQMPPAPMLSPPFTTTIDSTSKANKKIITMMTSDNNSSQYYTLYISDYDQEDGDVVQVYVNGIKIIHILIVKVKPNSFPIVLKKGINTIKVHALAEGSIPPTTLRLSLYSNTNNQAIYIKNLSLKKEESITEYIELQ